MKDICASLVANLNLFTEFSRSLEAAAEWWNLVKADLESPNPTLLPFEGESGDGGNFLNWAEMQQGFQQYYNVVRLHLTITTELRVISMALGKLGTWPHVVRRGLNVDEARKSLPSTRE